MSRIGNHCKLSFNWEFLLLIGLVSHSMSIHLFNCVLFVIMLYLLFLLNIFLVIETKNFYGSECRHSSAQCWSLKTITRKRKITFGIIDDIQWSKTTPYKSSLFFLSLSIFLSSVASTKMCKPDCNAKSLFTIHIIWWWHMLFCRRIVLFHYQRIIMLTKIMSKFYSFGFSMLSH